VQASGPPRHNADTSSIRFIGHGHVAWPWHGMAWQVYIEENRVQYMMRLLC
jgi:hypothetical protein